MANQEETLPTDIDAISFADDDGKVMARIAMLVTLYVKTAYETHMRQAVAECIDQYVDLTGSELRYALYESEKARDLRQQPLPSQQKRVLALDELASFDLLLNSGESPYEAGHFDLTSLLEGKRNFEHLGYLSATFSLAYLEKKPPGFFQDLVTNWCNRLSPYHGYAGFGLTRCMSTGSNQYYEPLLLPVVGRFPGLEFDNPNLHSLHLLEGIKGVNWLTVVSDDFLAQAGGKRVVKNGLPEGVLVTNYRGGLVFQAGPVPQLGDHQSGHVPTHYKQVYAKLKSVQSDHGGTSIMKTPKGVNGKAFTKAWLARFE